MRCAGGARGSDGRVHAPLGSLALGLRVLDDLRPSFRDLLFTNALRSGMVGTEGSGHAAVGENLTRMKHERIQADSAHYIKPWGAV